MIRLLIVLCGVLMLVACGGPVAAVAPTPLVQTVEVTRVVEVEVTREVIVTATPRPATPTPRATATPEPPPLTAAQASPIHSGPTAEYGTLGELAIGDPITALSQIEGWVEVEVGNETGWVPAAVVEGDLTTVPAYRGALVVTDGEIIQDYLADSVLFKGRVVNLGTQTAEGVTVEIELTAGDQRLNIQTGVVDTIDVEPGESSPFTVIMDDVAGWEYYYYTVRWRE